MVSESILVIQTTGSSDRFIVEANKVRGGSSPMILAYYVTSPIDVGIMVGTRGNVNSLLASVVKKSRS